MNRSNLKIILYSLAVFSIALVLLHKLLLTALGKALIVDSVPSRNADAAVILNTGVEYYPRLLHAARLYRDGRVRKIVINGNRKTDILRAIERDGFTPCCKWYADRLKILELYGVSKEDVITISAEDAFDTISEAKVVGNEIIGKDISSVIITTSKFHTRRAYNIWESMFGEKLDVFVSPAAQDPYNPQGWWYSARQIRWVMAETGAWAFLYWRRLTE